jgi:hypothetical protein
VQINPPVSLDVLDPPILEQTQFGDDAKQWLSNIVDIINASFQTLNQALANILAVGQTNVGGSGSGPITVTIAGLQTTNYVAVTLVSSTNPVTIMAVTSGSGSFNVTFSADPGASAIIVYQAYTTQPQ